jgi:hypothetical protein
MTIASTVCSASCVCEDAEGQGGNFSGSGEPSGSSSSAGEESTGAPFDASPWIGRYHYEDPWLSFGERGRPLGTPMLMNFEVREDSTATLFYDECGFESPVVIDYRWEASEDGWLHLHPGEGETHLRFMADEDIEDLRVLVMPPCRALMFENDGSSVGWAPFQPGESCWVDRCSTPGTIQVGYCEGEEPPPCP